MDVFTLLRTPELRFGDFLVPWGVVIGTLGFLSAWVAVSVIERLGWTRGLWHLPLFFRGAVDFLGCIFRADLCAMRISRAHLVTFAMVALAMIATASLYWRYSTRPWTRDAQVRANVVGIAPTSRRANHSNPDQRQPGSEEGRSAF